MKKKYAAIDIAKPVLSNNVWNSNEFTAAIKQFDTFNKYLNQLPTTASTEGFGTSLIKGFISVADLFSKVGNSFKTNIFKFYKTTKRSEMKKFHEDHMLMCNKVESTNYATFSNMKVDIPSGTKSKIIDATLAIDKIYKVMDMENVSSAFITALENTRRCMTRKEKYNHTLTDIFGSINANKKAIDLSFDESNKIFTGTSTSKVEFKTVYSTMEEFKSVRTTCLDMEGYLHAANNLIVLIDKADLILADITNYLTDDSEVDKAFITSLITIMKELATRYDKYGMTATRQMAVEHNHILNIQNAWNIIE